MTESNHDQGRASTYVPALRFRWLTPAYDVVVSAGTRERAFKAELIRQATPAAGERVLDVASGTGTLAIAIRQQCPAASVTGIDGDPGIIRIATRKAAAAGAAVGFDHGLSYALPYADATFDLVVSSLFLHHLSPADKLRTAREMLRVLKPGGRLQLADWGPATGPFTRAGFLLVQLLDGFTNTQDNIQGRIPSTLQEAGFQHVVETCVFPTFFGAVSLCQARKST